MLVHPARTFDFRQLRDGLADANANGLVYSRLDSETGLRLYVYTSRTVFEDAWDDVTLLARGLVLDERNERVAATPFPKFFNAGEKRGDIPALPFEAFEKLDGSLIVIFHAAGKWRCITKGAWDSMQAVWAQGQLDAIDLSPLTVGTTYLAEAISPENRIVVAYERPELVMLAAYDEAGNELSYDAITATAEALGWRVAERTSFASMAELTTHTLALPRSSEGYVVRFEDGTRLKLKGAEYRRIHALISRCTPLAMWEAMVAGDDLTSIKRDLPEEFWSDFDHITGLLGAQRDAILGQVAATADALAHLTDKEVGLQLKSLPDTVRPFIFNWRNTGGKLEGRAHDVLLRMIRPTGNELSGYQPSYALTRVMEESI
jgi:RNA ligase